jgi:hypothetical protein
MPAAEGAASCAGGNVSGVNAGTLARGSPSWPECRSASWSLLSPRKRPLRPSQKGAYSKPEISLRHDDGVTQPDQTSAIEGGKKK